MSKQGHKIIRIGAGAGYSGDRIEPAVALAERGELHYLAFECLAERTIALAQQRKQQDPETGFDPLLEARMRACLPVCHRRQVRVVSNMGAANPLAAMRKTAAIAAEMGLQGLRIAALTGDDVYRQIIDGDFTLLETGAPLHSIRDRIISANAYLGVGPIVAALAQGADVVLTGRVADPALFLAPLVHEFGWSLDQYDLLGQGTVLGHLLECAGQVTGGYFADPGVKEVPDLGRLGFPLAEVTAEGDFVITKLPDAGGMVTPATCKEQLLYEIHDPARYLTPDVVADFTRVQLTEIGKDRVQVTGAAGHPKTGLLKVSVGYRDGFNGEGQISYGGPGAVERARLAIRVLQQRFQDTKLDGEDIRYDLIGMNALYGDTLPPGSPAEVRLRVSARTARREDAARVANEVEALYTNGPAGGGGVTKSVTEVIAIASVLIPEEAVTPQIHWETTG